MGSSSARVEIRIAEAGADLEAYVAVWNAAVPEDVPAVVQQRLEREPQRLYLLAEHDGRPVGCGFAGASDAAGRGVRRPTRAPRRSAAWPRIHPDRGPEHLEGLGFETAGAHVDGNDAGSLAFARRFGFEEVDRQVEQVRTIGKEPAGEPPPGVTFVTIAERPELLREAYPLGAEGWADMATSEPVTISLDDWLADEATFPEGSFVAARRRRDRRLLRSLPLGRRRRDG